MQASGSAQRQEIARQVKATANSWSRAAEADKPEGCSPDTGMCRDQPEVRSQAEQGRDEGLAEPPRSRAGPRGLC